MENEHILVFALIVTGAKVWLLYPVEDPTPLNTWREISMDKVPKNRLLATKRLVIGRSSLGLKSKLSTKKSVDCCFEA